MAIVTERLTYEADGLAMEGYLYGDDAATRPLPGVLVFPEGHGLGDHAKGKARRLAEAGYVALAGDLHGGERLLTELDEMIESLGPMFKDPSKTRARAQGALDALCARAEVDPARTASIGFCFGGTMSLELARSGAPVSAVVGFHSGLATTDPADAANIKGKVLVCLGADDPGIGPDVRAAFEQEMRGGGVDWRMHLYGGVVHSFTNPAAGAMGRPDFARYDAAADERSWSEMLALFEEVFN